jgi:hypothetical protein
MNVIHDQQEVRGLVHYTHRCIRVIVRIFSSIPVDL